MELKIKVFNTTEAKPIPRKKIIDSVKSTLIGEKINEAEINIILVNDDTIHELNKRFLKHDRPTDVISFSLEENRIDAEIYISLDTAQQQASEFNVTLSNEILRLAIHGTLHIVGYGDKTKKEKQIMTELENKYLNIN